MSTHFEGPVVYTTFEQIGHPLLQLNAFSPPTAFRVPLCRRKRSPPPVVLVQTSAGSNRRENGESAAIKVDGEDQPAAAKRRLPNPGISARSLQVRKLKKVSSRVPLFARRRLQAFKCLFIFQSACGVLRHE